MKFVVPKTFSNLLKNKLVLNIVAVISLLNLIGYLVLGNMNAIFLFIVIGILTRYFSKNMIIVLGVPLIVVNLLTLQNNKYIEGMDVGSDNEKKQDRKQEEVEPIKKEVKKDVIETKRTNQGLPLHPLENTSENSEDNTAQSTGSDTQGFEAGRQKNRGYNIDYATTIEDAYDELNKILGSDGIKRLTDDTQKLMGQQLKLAEAMKGMAPVMESITPMVKNLQGMMNQLGGENMMKSLTSMSGK
jgi:hypothetical protein